MEELQQALAQKDVERDTVTEGNAIKCCSSSESQTCTNLIFLVFHIE